MTTGSDFSSPLVATLRDAALLDAPPHNSTSSFWNPGTAAQRIASRRSSPQHNATSLCPTTSTNRLGNALLFIVNWEVPAR